MDNLSIWRSRAKIVAIIDLIFSSFDLLLTIWIAAVTLYTTIVVNKADAETMKRVEDKTGFTKSEINAMTIFMWVVTGIFVVVTAIQLWAAIKLLNATELGRNAHEAHKMARTWRTVTVVFLVISVISGIVSLSLVTLAIELIIRGIFLSIVYQFIKELEGVTTASAHDPVGGFIV